MTRVVAGILRQGGAILACRRRLNDAFGGKWEFPGGKIRKAETAPDALVRELQEELGISAEPGPEVDCIRHQYSGYPPVEIRFFEIASFRNEPENLNFEDIRWLEPVELPDLDWLEADWPLVRRLASSDGRPLAPRSTAPNGPI